MLRGTLNSAQYMDYIFAMMFLKWMNDQFDLEQQKFTDGNKSEGMDDETIAVLLSDSSVYDTFCTGAGQMEQAKRLEPQCGPELDKAFKAVEDEPKNSELVGVLTTANYNDKERVPDSKLNQLLQIFNGMNLSNEGLESPNIMGDVYIF